MPASRRNSPVTSCVRSWLLPLTTLTDTFLDDCRKSGRPCGDSNGQAGWLIAAGSRSGDQANETRLFAAFSCYSLLGCLRLRGGGVCLCAAGVFVLRLLCTLHFLLLSLTEAADGMRPSREPPTPRGRK